MKSSKRLLIGLFVFSVVLPTMATPAIADTVSVTDPNDTNGRLDIRRIAHSHAADGRLKHRVSTYRRFGPRALRHGHILLHLAPPSEDAHRYVLVFSYKRRIRAVIGDDQDFIGLRRVTRPNRKSVVVWLRPTDLGDPPSYRWQALSQWSAPTGPCSESCLDHAPNRRYLKHTLEA
jgi:hypothetical protein